MRTAHRLRSFHPRLTRWSLLALLGALLAALLVGGGGTEDSVGLPVQEWS